MNAPMIGHQFSISVFWNAASASAKINTEARSFSCLLRPTICRCHADLADWLDDQPVPGEGQPSFERHVTGERQSVADRVAESPLAFGIHSLAAFHTAAIGSRRQPGLPLRRL